MFYGQKTSYNPAFFGTGFVVFSSFIFCSMDIFVPIKSDT